MEGERSLAAAKAGWVGEICKLMGVCTEYIQWCQVEI